MTIPIKLRTQNSLPGVFQRARPTADNFGGGRAKALGDLGAGLHEAADEYDAFLEERANTKAKEIDVERARRLRELLYADRTVDPESGEETVGHLYREGRHALDALPSVDDQLRQLGEYYGNIDDEFTRKKIDEMWIAREERARLSIDQHTNKSQSVYNESVSRARIEEAADALLDQPLSVNNVKEQISRIAQETTAIGNRAGLSQEEITGEVRNAVSSNLTVAIGAVLDSKGLPHAQQMFANVASRLEPEDEAKIRGVLKREGERLAAKARAEQRARAAEFRPRLEGAFHLASIGQDPQVSREEITAILGAEDGAKVWSQLQDQVRVGNDVAALSGMSYDEARQTLADYDARLAAATPENAVQLQKERDTLFQAAKLVDKALREDPIAFIQANDLAVQQQGERVADLARQAAEATDPEQRDALRQEYLTAHQTHWQMRKEALAEKVGTTPERVPLLQDAEAAEFARMINEAEPEARVALLNSLSEEAGPLADQFFREIADDIPFDASLIAAYSDAPRAQQLIVDMSLTDRKENIEAAGARVPSGWKKRVVTSTNDIYVALSAGGGGDAQATANQYAQLMMDTSAYLIVHEGLTDTEAAAKARKILFDEHFDVKSTGRIRGFVRKDEFGESLLPHVEELAREALSAANLETAGVRRAGSTLEANVEAKILEDDGYFVTFNENGREGLRLVVPDQGTILVPTDANDEPIEILYEDATARRDRPQPEGFLNFDFLTGSD